jgi:Cytosol aminopeptidase family, N-terminal domain
MKSGEASMHSLFVFKRFALTLVIGVVFASHQIRPVQAQTLGANSKSSLPAMLEVPNSPIPAYVLVQSPSETTTELQIICLFESTPANTLHASLIETNQKLKGLLDTIRTPTRFRGELGETLLLTPGPQSIRAKRLLIIGLGDSESYTPHRMELIGSIAYHESNRLGIKHPFFAPTVIDGGVSKFNAGDTAEQFFAGFLRAARTQKTLMDAGVSAGPAIEDLTFLAGATHSADAEQGMQRAVASH